MGSMEGVVSVNWQGRRVLITGHTGFKGSWLALWLARMGAEVTGLALDPPTEPSLFRVARVDADMRSMLGNVCDPRAVQAAFHEARPEVVVHMAAQSLVRASYAEPVDTYMTNVLGTARVLDEVRRVPSVRAVIVVTSDKCYENREWPWPYRETDSLGGFDPYSNSKACAELVVSSFRSSFFHPERISQHGVAIATARAGNVIGGGDWAADRLVPDAARAFQSGTPLEVRNPDAVRPWQHVLEPLRGYLVLAQALLHDGHRYAGSWNFGPLADAVQPVHAVLKSFAQHWPAAAWRTAKGPQPHEAGTLCLDCAKSRVELGWTAALSFQEAVTYTAEWYTRFYRGEDARALCEAQLDRYQVVGSFSSTLP